MTVFSDENLPPALAAGLHELEQGLKYASEGIVVVRHVVDVFGKGKEDEVWVPAAATYEGCVIITEDWKMQRIKQLQPICRN